MGVDGFDIDVGVVIDMVVEGRLWRIVKGFWIGYVGVSLGVRSDGGEVRSRG